jgi:hypothetical protein
MVLLGAAAPVPKAADVGSPPYVAAALEERGSLTAYQIEETHSAAATASALHGLSMMPAARAAVMARQPRCRLEPCHRSRNTRERCPSPLPIAAQQELLRLQLL